MHPLAYVVGVIVIQLLPWHWMFSTLVVACAMLALKKARILDDPRPRKRRASFATRGASSEFFTWRARHSCLTGLKHTAQYSRAVCVEGVFPPDAGIPEPVIQGVFHFAHVPPTKAAVAALVRRSLLFYTRFRARPELVGTRCVGWHDAPPADQVAVDEHVIEHRVATRDALRELISQLAIARLPVDRPCWEVHTVHVQEGA